MTRNDILEDTALALGFLTRLPLPDRWFSGNDGTLTSAARAFPLAGALIAVPGAFVLVAARVIDLPDSVAALLAVATLIAVTGALHEDGLADVADGFFGGGDPGRRLEIMKDSRIGSFGTIALVLSLALRIVLLAAIIQRAGAARAAFALLGVEAVARGTMVWFWQAMPSVRPGGTADGAGTPDADALRFALASAAGIGVMTFLPVEGLYAVLIPGAIMAAAILGFAQLARDKIGGHTGDTLGAAQQIAVLSLLLGLVIAL